MTVLKCGPYEDFIVAWRPFRDMAGEKGTIQFYKDFKSELEERVKKGIAAASKEKYRILWLGLPMWFDIDLLDYLEERGAVVVADTMFHPSGRIEVDLSDPLRALVEKEYWGWDMYGNSDGSQPRCGLSSGSHVLDMIKDYHVDGVIEHSIISCRACTIGNRHIGKIIRNELQVPVISIESHMNNLAGYSPSEVRQRMDDFIAILEEQANEKHC
jgi:benzoyl-CoA reductase/2-hydroxyglutaryl-CoA dehydratase subunit BcrC/BadD/HgdB